MQKDFNDMLQDRLQESKQIDKAFITHFLEDTWEGVRESKPEENLKIFDEMLAGKEGSEKFCIRGKIDM